MDQMDPKLGSNDLMSPMSPDVSQKTDSGFYYVKSGNNDEGPGGLFAPPLPPLNKYPSSPVFDSKEDLDESNYESQCAYVLNEFQTNFNEFQRFIAHEDFGLFMLLACKVKIVRNNLICGYSPNATDILSISHIESRKGADELSGTARNIQTKLLLGSNALCIDLNNIVIPRGVLYITDTLIEDSIVSLCQEFNRCMTWYSSMKGNNIPSVPSRKKIKLESEDDMLKESIGIKYAKWQTDILTDWMIEYKSHPFPDHYETEQLALATGLTTRQIINWTTNVRKRNLKATVEKGKKPHHFLDFLFLADNRDKRAAGVTYTTPSCRTPALVRNKHRKNISQSKMKTKVAVKSRQVAKRGKSLQALKRGALNNPSSPAVTKNAVEKNLTQIKTSPDSSKSSPFTNMAKNVTQMNFTSPSNINNISSIATQNSAQMLSYQPKPVHTTPSSETQLLLHMQSSIPVSMNVSNYQCVTPQLGTVITNYEQYWRQGFSPYTHISQHSPHVTPPQSYDTFEQKVAMVTDKPGNWMLNLEDVSEQNDIGFLATDSIKSESSEEKKDLESQMLDRISKEGLVSTPPRNDEDDTVWGEDLDSHVNLKDIFSRSRLSDVSMDSVRLPDRLPDVEMEDSLTQSEKSGKDSLKISATTTKDLSLKDFLGSDLDLTDDKTSLNELDSLTYDDIMQILDI